MLKHMPIICHLNVIIFNNNKIYILVKPANIYLKKIIKKKLIIILTKKNNKKKRFNLSGYNEGFL